MAGTSSGIVRKRNFVSVTEGIPPVLLRQTLPPFLTDSEISIKFFRFFTLTCDIREYSVSKHAGVRTGQVQFT